MGKLVQVDFALSNGWRVKECVQQQRFRIEWRVCWLVCLLLDHVVAGSGFCGAFAV